MTRANRVASLQQLKEAGLQIELQKPHSGTVEIVNLPCRVEIEPQEVLRVQLCQAVGRSLFESAGFGPKLLARQTNFLTPVKFTVGEDLTELQLTGELPLNGEASLPIAFQLLSHGIIDACSKNGGLQPKSAKKPIFFLKPVDKDGLEKGQQQSKERTSPSKSLPAAACKLSATEIKNQLEIVCKNSGDELVAQPDGWRLSFNTADYFQQINISLDHESCLMRCRAVLVAAPMEVEVVQIALAAFVLEASSRLRFVRGLMLGDPITNQMTTALEVVVPGEYSKVLSPRVAIESLKAATQFTRLACEAMSEPSIADEYLSRRAQVDSQTHKKRPRNSH